MKSLKLSVTTLLLLSFFPSVASAKPLRAGAQAQSVILFIGDGMGMSAVTATRLWAHGPKGKLEMEKLPQSALVKTYSADSYVTDSAAAATAMSTGFKTNLFLVAQDKSGIADKKDGKPLTTILELARARGMATGLVTTTSVTHATPACFYAHHNFRHDEEGVALQLLNDGGKVDVVLGGGRKYFAAGIEPDPETKEVVGRADHRDLIGEMQKLGYAYVWRQREFDSIDPRKVSRLFGLFNVKHLSYEIDRKDDIASEPSLSELTQKAIAILKNNPNGYFLMVEGGRIDHAAHGNDALRLVSDTLEFDKAVAVGVKESTADTLLLVTADHETSGLAINGYATELVQGKRLFGNTAGKDGTEQMPFSILSFSTGPGLKRSPLGKRPENERFTPSGHNLSEGNHTAVDVILLAKGPGSEAVRGFMENTEIFQIMKKALGL